jgi:hypothetical protein
LSTADWRTYQSSQYGFTVGVPPDWLSTPASRSWSFETDGDYDAVVTTPGADHFATPAGDIHASVWAIPLDPGTVLETEHPSPGASALGDGAGFLSWIEAYCTRTGNMPCTGIAERAVPMCLERRDCHPAFLVPFQDDVQAFFSGGNYDGEAMTVVAVWRSDGDPEVSRFGGSRRLLEAFLSTMDVWPADRPADQP